jgi:hypothetical protein
MRLKPEQLSQVFGAAASPAANSALEAPSEAHFDILFSHSAAASHWSKFASNEGQQGGQI